ncbi:EAL domain-containing protein [Novosphingobium mangrovi (ex Huang et al. 2023)]|uniref:EAL domain-containing protein n=1 Tax=Novosphingobium mangrovi (ex Huang et al. 2023) TaxID=2976432 RepID=A0ABT2I698_9SPHN|nr:EAL domain-containing protein [Novosphingobium mangrovi (ex Huang et al. 2023)]MCT2400338.1 EAL domain-containing protein [Novosphingobium mangrovi (ex Huang et al. 2023)]
MLEFKAEILELIVKGSSLADVMDHICRHIEARFPDVACSVLTVDRNGTLHPLAAPSLPKAYSQSLDNLSVGPNVGSCGTAAYTGKPVVITDIATDPRWMPFPAFQEATLSIGFKACWSSPLVDTSGIVLATFALYFRAKRGPTDDEREMVSACLHLCDLAFARHQRVTARELRANTDALTSLPNRGSFTRALAHLDCDKPGSWALLVIDLDNLKTINDTFGHAIGDELIQEVAFRLGQFAIPDSAFRIGGDEFVILIKDPKRLSDLAQTAQEVSTVLAAPVEFAHFSIVPEATTGAAIVTGDETDPQAVLRNADLALYHAKETNRGAFVRYWPGIDTRMTARLSSMQNVDAALNEGRIEAWYQPIVRLDDQRIVGLEALCRMISPAGDVLPAATFAEAMSDAHIASLLTHRMFTSVRDDMRRWLDHGIDFGSVSVNVTAADLRGGRLQSALDEIFVEKALLERLVLEVTESVYIDDHDKTVIDAVVALKDRGVRIALDDFGTGFASLTHLLDLPVDFIKIDQSFTARLPVDEVSGTIIAGLVAIARKLDASITAEGVETPVQAAALLDLGCELGQGFLFSPCVNRGDASRLLMHHAATNPHGVPLPGQPLQPQRESSSSSSEPERLRK